MGGYFPYGDQHKLFIFFKEFRDIERRSIEGKTEVSYLIIPIEIKILVFQKECRPPSSHVSLGLRFLSYQMEVLDCFLS